eukprot:TRINITY_DN6998_c0_g2_i1.p1 TRINITY_DN6998_c0_g2~~TRINITY_DN6998_c0_g2_i1.p1  ORF type:complete len:304 (+),score=34.64 TRINITY_DN6998_c0_g2_i1:273-1184(+)
MTNTTMLQHQTMDKKIVREPPRQPPFIANLLAGGIAGIIGTCSIFPLDMVKTRLQNSKGNYSGFRDCFTQIIRNEGGPRALYKGISANLVGVTPEKALKLAVNDFLRQKIQGNNPHITFTQEILAGAGAGFCQVIATNPMEITKINMQIAGEQGRKASLIQTVKMLGFRGLYKGTPATLLRDIPFSMVYFSLYGRLKHNFKDPNTGHTPIVKVFQASCIAGTFAAIIATPADVIKTRLQITPVEGGPTYTGIADCFQKTVSKEGFSALFKGVVPRVLIITPLFGIALVCYELEKKLYHEYSKS